MLRKFDIIGYSIWNAEEIINHLSVGNSPSGIPGDFVIVMFGEIKEESFLILISSYTSAIPYFCCTTKEGDLLHGTSVFDVYKKADFPWQWNERALFCLNNFDHLIGADTVHTGISRLKNASVVINHKKQTNTTNYTLNSIQALSLAEAVEVYKDLTDDYFFTGEDIFLSLSAGMDSRLLLASCLFKGARPVVATMGSHKSTDVKVAKSIANSFALPHEVIGLTIKDYLDEKNKKQIVYTTSGTKTLNNWHTYIYISKVKYPKNITHFAGSNGELVRSYYFDKGLVAKLLQTCDFGFFELYFKLKLKKGKQYVLNSIRKKNYEKEVGRLINELTPGKNAMDRFDDFYSNQRIRHFIGNGIALYNLFYKTQSPFLDFRFIQMAKALNRQHKLNSVFHKKAIERLCPKLLMFPTAENNCSIADFHTNFYFLKNSGVVSYAITNELLSSPDFKASVIDDSGLDEWISRDERNGLFISRKMRQISFLATLAETKRIVNEVDKIKTSSLK